MARGATLVSLLDKLRIAARLSLNPAHNADDRAYQVQNLQSEQERLWDDFDWPHLRVEVQIPIQAGQRYYDTPEPIALDRLERIDFFADGCWRQVPAGIAGPEYSAWNSDLDERSWPVRRWAIAPSEDIELWPISDRDADPVTRDGYLKFTGIRKLRPLVDDDDRADLDDQMLVNYAAASMLAAKGSKDAGLRLEAANARYARLRGRMTPRTKFQLFGVGERIEPRRITITQYRPAGS